MHKTPYIRLLNVIAMVVIIGLTTILFLRWMGTQQAYPTVNHPWMSRSHWQVARLSPEDCSQLALENLVQLGQGWIYWIDLQINVGGEPRIVCPRSKLFEIKSPFEPGPELSRVTSLLRDQSVIFNLRASDISASTPFLKAIEPWGEKTVDVGVASASQSLIRDLRKKRPEWLFAADASTWTKLKFFQAFGLETIVDLWPDFFVASLDANEANHYDPASAFEISRRKKFLLLELDDKSSPSPPYPSVKGVLTTRPKNFSADTFFEKTGAE